MNKKIIIQKSSATPYTKRVTVEIEGVVLTHLFQARSPDELNDLTAVRKLTHTVPTLRPEGGERESLLYLFYTYLGYLKNFGVYLLDETISNFEKGF